ncbi:hypothetical protein [Cryptosporangium sp. NPDC051539]|uniref:hypothetical protein n=1 Tax=Cryptosporangium sp. NPDC051539 TaxID=3363962 RepID=UPI0037BC797C
MTSLEATELAPADSMPLQPIEWPAAPPQRPLKQPTPRRPLLAALIGLACGAFLVGGVWVGGSLLTGTSDGPAKDAAEACTIVRGLPAFTTENFVQSDGSRLYRAGELSAAAAQTEARYQRLAEATRQAYLSSSDLDLDAVNQQVRIAVSECAG